MRKVYIIHGWEGYPEEGWFPWLKKELEKKGFSVSIPAMPDPEVPVIESWLAKLKAVIKNPGLDTVLIGHSIGCQAILIYLERLPESIVLGKVVLVCPWLHLSEETMADEETAEIAKPWLNTPINWEKVRSKATNFTAIFSETDPHVPLTEADLFQSYLDAKIVRVKGPGHLGGEDKVIKLPEVLTEFP